MNINRQSAKHVAQAMINDTKPSVILNSAIYVIISYIIANIVTKLSGMHEYVIDLATNYKATGELYFGPWPEVGTVAIVLCIILAAMQLILEVGFANYTLCVSRGRATTFFSIFSGFDYPVKAMIISIFRKVVVDIGMSLFVVPGVILNYWYSMAYFVLADNPEYGIVECLRKSRKMVKGYKMQLFYLDISFMGWIFAAEMTAAYMFPIVDILLLPYMNITKALYYNLISHSEYIFRTFVRDGEGNGTNVMGSTFKDDEYEPTDSQDNDDDKE